MFLFLLFFSLSLCYEVTIERRSDLPDLSFVRSDSTFEQVFNPSWVEPRSGTQGRSGLLVRSQNCSATVGGPCVRCGGSKEKASVLTFSEYNQGKLLPIKDASVVFGPTDDSDSWGTEDPRIAFNEHDNLYYMFYTAYNGSSILLSLATTPDPSSPKYWKKLGPVFPTIKGSKSAALLIRDDPPHYLFWGDSNIKVTKSQDPSVWDSPGVVFIEPRHNSFDDLLVESGPPPLKLSTGDYIFFYNSASVNGTVYHPAWVILDKNDPTIIKQRATSPLLSPTLPWETGVAPFTCNVANVIFLEAAFSLGGDKFMVFYGGSDAVIGSAIVTVITSRD